MTPWWLGSESRVFAAMQKGAVLHRMTDKTRAGAWRWWIEPQGEEIDGDIAEALVKAGRVEASDFGLFGDCAQSFVIRQRTPTANSA